MRNATKCISKSTHLHNKMNAEEGRGIVICGVCKRGVTSRVSAKRANVLPTVDFVFYDVCEDGIVVTLDEIVLLQLKSQQGCNSFTSLK